MTGPVNDPQRHPQHDEPGCWVITQADGVEVQTPLQVKDFTVTLNPRAIAAMGLVAERTDAAVRRGVERLAASLECAHD